MIKVSSDFDHGNIAVIDASASKNIRLEIKPDGKAKFFQWFYYCVEGAKDETLSMRIENAGGASYVGGWHDYRAVASYDGETWFRVGTSYADGVLTIDHKPEQDEIFYAYFAAYPVARYRQFIETQKQAPLLAHSVIGETLDGQEIDMFATGSGPSVYWVIARQHPGETMASWWMEGFLERLADADDAAAQVLREKATVFVIPCMNLDGSKRGHLRTNAAGTDLNRAWRNASMEASPEVYLVREKMHASGVDFFLDVHGDEAIPNNFLNSAIGIPGWSDRHQARIDHYSSLLLEESAHFQTKDGYPDPPPGKANLDIATNYVAETWDCLAMTLEMPFKDANVNPDPVYGWSPEGCRKLGQDNLSVMAKMVDALR